MKSFEKLTTVAETEQKTRLHSRVPVSSSSIGNPPWSRDITLRFGNNVAPKKSKLINAGGATFRQ